MGYASKELEGGERVLQGGLDGEVVMNERGGCCVTAPITWTTANG